MRKLTGKMPQTKSGDPILCEPAQSKCRANLYGNLQVKCCRPKPGHALCASPRSRYARGDFTRATLCRNLQVKCRKPAGAPWSSTGLYTYRKNPSVWTHCLGKKMFSSSRKSLHCKRVTLTIFWLLLHYIRSIGPMFGSLKVIGSRRALSHHNGFTGTYSRSIKLTLGLSKMLFHHHCFATISVYKCQLFEPSIYFCRITPLHCTNYNNNISWDIWWVQQTALPKSYHCD